MIIPTERHNLSAAIKSPRSHCPRGCGEDFPNGRVESPNAGDEVPNARVESPNGRDEVPNAREENPNGGGDVPNAGEENPNGGGEVPNARAENPNAGDENPNVGGAHPSGPAETPDARGRHSCAEGSGLFNAKHRLGLCRMQYETLDRRWYFDRVGLPSAGRGAARHANLRGRSE